MVELRFESTNRVRLERLGQAFSSGFAGWDAFVDNTVVVPDPVEMCGSEGHYTLDIVIGPETGKDMCIDIDIDKQLGLAAHRSWDGVGQERRTKI